MLRLQKKKNLLRGRNSAEYGCGLTVWLVLGVGISGYAVLGYLEVIKLV